MIVVPAWFADDRASGPVELLVIGGGLLLVVAVTLLTPVSLGCFLIPAVLVLTAISGAFRARRRRLGRADVSLLIAEDELEMRRRGARSGKRYRFRTLAKVRVRRFGLRGWRLVVTRSWPQWIYAQPINVVLGDSRRVAAALRNELRRRIGCAKINRSRS